jgi:sortase A
LAPDATRSRNRRDRSRRIPIETRIEQEDAIEAEAQPGPEPEAEATVRPDAEAQAVVGSEAEAEAMVGPDGEAHALIGPEPEAEAVVEPETEAEALPGPEAEAEARAEAPRAARRGPRGYRILWGLAETLITLGVISILFVAYEYWGTSYLTSRSQAHLRHVAGTQGFVDYQLPSGTPSQVVRPGGGSVPHPRPRLGSALGFIKIPRMKLDMVFVEGADVDSLKLGPGHYPSTPLPGQGGNVAIAGHRTTYLHPFWSLNELRPGDKITLETKYGVFLYRVVWQKIILPDDRWVLGPTPVPSLTLTACHPRFSASHRIVIRAVQISGPGLAAPAPVT